MIFQYVPGTNVGWSTEVFKARMALHEDSGKMNRLCTFRSKSFDMIQYGYH